MNKFDLIATCHFGLESVLKREIYNLGYTIKNVTDGRITFEGDSLAISRSNIFLRTAERVMIKVAEFKAENFDELFENTKKIDIVNYIPKNAKFYVSKVSSINSKLFSARTIQSMVKKAMVDKMCQVYKTDLIREIGSEYEFRVYINKDIVTIALDTSGKSLQMRGYRKYTTKAPISETLASGLLQLTYWNKDRILVDPFCGSGTFLIEAAMLGKNIAPGMNREFISENYTNLIDKKLWYKALEEANDLIDNNVKLNLQGYDIDKSCIEACIHNAHLAEVEKDIHFQVKDVNEFSSKHKYGFVVTNPPYGQRLADEAEAKRLLKILSNKMEENETWSFYFITSYENTKNCIKRKLTKNRKIYNGMIKTYFYTYEGLKPTKNGGKYGARE